MHCAEQFLELKICISPQFRAIDPPNPAGGFIQQNENVRFATAACMQKYGNVRFATVACAKCMRYGGRGGDHTMGGGGWQHGTRNHIYIYINMSCRCFSRPSPQCGFAVSWLRIRIKSLLSNSGKGRRLYHGNPSYPPPKLPPPPRNKALLRVY